MRQVYQQPTPSKAAPVRKRYEIDHFRGVDFEHNPTDVDITRSPLSLNMVRMTSTTTVGDSTTQGDASIDIGAIRKRMGYSIKYLFAATNEDRGVRMGFSFDGKMFVVDGKQVHLVNGDTITDVGGAAASSGIVSGWEFGGNYYIADGAKFRQLYKSGSSYAIRMLSTTDGDGVVYVPTVIISRLPGTEKGGTPYEGYNLIGRRFTNSFYVSADDATEAEFYLTDQNLAAYNKVEVMDADGNWVVKTQHDGDNDGDYTFSAADGKVEFRAGHLPGRSPVEGMDNVRITAALGSDQFAPMCAKIDKCTVGILYGVAGLTDRLFLSGNPDFPNYEWYSEKDDPTYFPDRNYSVLGEDGSAITGYSIVNEKLIAHKSNSADGRNAYIQVGQMIDGKAEFPVTGALQGEGCVSPKGFAFLRTEPLFVTSRGVYAIAPSDVLGERYSQIRSAYINGRLLRAPGGLSDANAVVYRDLYLLFIGQRVYVLDGLQRSYLKDEPYSQYQYESYYWKLGLAEGENVTSAWVHDGELWFGTSVAGETRVAGNVYKFYSDPDDPESYNDNGVAINAIWDTPYLSGSVKYNRKTFLYLAATLQAYYATSLQVYAKRFGLWVQQWNDQAGARYLDFEHIDFGDSDNALSRFTFSTDTTQVLVRHKVDVRYVDKAMFRLRNAVLNEPFVLYDAAIEYIETNKLR